MRILLLLVLLSSRPLTAQVPDGFRSIFNGSNLAGWHMSLSNHHGDTKEWRVYDGAIVGKQDRDGNGGVLLSDETFSDFEVHVEVKPDFGCDGGLYLRSSESGQAYQVMLDYLDGGNVGGIFGERLDGVEMTEAKTWQDAWKTDDWNVIRARIRGMVPQIEVWLNGAQMVDFRDTANHLPNGAIAGSVALQVHGGDRCRPGLEHRFRNLAVRTL